MNVVSKGDRLACVQHANGTLRIYRTDQHGGKKPVGCDDSFFVDIPFTQDNSHAACKLVAEACGLHAVAAGEGLGGSLLFDLV
jgi:hypothetical protein